MTHDELEDQNRTLRLMRRRLAGGTTVAVVATTAPGATLRTLEATPSFFPTWPGSRRVSDFHPN